MKKLPRFLIGRTMGDVLPNSTPKIVFDSGDTTGEYICNFDIEDEDIYFVGRGPQMAIIKVDTPEKSAIADEIVNSWDHPSKRHLKFIDFEMKVDPGPGKPLDLSPENLTMVPKLAAQFKPVINTSEGRVISQKSISEFVDEVRNNRRLFKTTVLDN